MRDVVLLALTGLFTLIALRRPLVGMLAFVSLSILGPHSFTWGIARTFPHSQVVGLATVVGFLLSSEAKNFPREREARLVLALWALVTVSTLFALQPEQAWNQLLFVSKIFLMMFLCTAIVNTPERLHMLVRVIALSLGFLALKTGTVRAPNRFSGKGLWTRKYLSLPGECDRDSAVGQPATLGLSLARRTSALAAMDDWCNVSSFVSGRRGDIFPGRLAELRGRVCASRSVQSAKNPGDRTGARSGTRMGHLAEFYRV